MTAFENVIQGCGFVKQPHGQTQFLVYHSSVYVIV